jgi:hypothetical protein
MLRRALIAIAVALLGISEFSLNDMVMATEVLRLAQSREVAALSAAQDLRSAVRVAALARRAARQRATRTSARRSWMLRGIGSRPHVDDGDWFVGDDFRKFFRFVTRQIARANCSLSLRPACVAGAGLRAQRSACWCATLRSPPLSGAPAPRSTAVTSMRCASSCVDCHPRRHGKSMSASCA